MIKLCRDQLHSFVHEELGLWTQPPHAHRLLNEQQSMVHMFAGEKTQQEDGRKFHSEIGVNAPGRYAAALTQRCYSLRDTSRVALCH